MARLKGELQADNGDVLYPHTSAEVVFMADGTKAEEKIKDIEQKVTNIDVSGDVRQVINERVNADTSKPLSTLISEWVNGAKTALLNAVSTLTTHVTSQHTATKNHVTTKVDALPQKSVWTDARGAKLDNLNQSITTTQTNINNNTNAARDNIKNHMDVARDNIKNHVTSILNSPKVVKSVQRGLLNSSAKGSRENGIYYQDVTIASVVMTKALVLVTSTDAKAANAKLVNGTTLRIYSGAQYGGDSFDATNCNWQVIEFY